jgi:serine protease Do
MRNRTGPLTAFGPDRLKENTTMRSARTIFRIILPLGAAFAVGAFWANGLVSRGQATERTLSAPLPESQTSSMVAELGRAFRAAAQTVEPSVVHIEISSKGDAEPDQGMQPPAWMPDEFFRRFFPMPDNPSQGEGETESYGEFDAPRKLGAGSGWVYDDKGHIITNNHVVRNASIINVKLYDQREVKAKVVGTDPQTDIAVLQVDASDLRPARLSKDPVEQGDFVLAFGSPLEFTFSMSQGIVSGKERQVGILGSSGYESFIQTDAAINPGNSGGPLTNINGEVVGMNTAIATRTGLFSGVGFAIPAAMIQDIVTQLIDNGHVTRGYLGVSIQDNPDLLKSFGYDGKGVLVSDVVEGHAGARAGLQAGDIITEVDDRPVPTSQELRRLIASRRPGHDVALKIFRDGRYKTIQANLSEMPKDLAGNEAPQLPSNDNEDAPESGSEALRQLGLSDLATVTPDLASRLDLSVQRGVLIEGVRPGSISDAQGLARGMVVVGVRDERVSSVRELADAVARADLKRGVRLTVRIEDSNRYVYLKLDE